MIFPDFSQFSQLSQHCPSETDLPDGIWMQIDNLIVFDRVKGKIWAIAYADLRDPGLNLEQAYREAGDRITKLVLKLQLPLPIEAKSLSWRSPESLGNTNVEELVFQSNTQKRKNSDRR